MEYLSDVMWAATADAPPTAIDLDRMIDAHRRGARRRRWIGAATGVAVLVALGATMPVLLRGGPAHQVSPLTPAASPPTITCFVPRSGLAVEGPCGAMETRLNRAIIGAVDRIAPAARLANLTVNPADDALDVYDGYLTFGYPTSGRAKETIAVTVMPAHPKFRVPPPADCSSRGHTYAGTPSRCEVGNWSGGVYAAREFNGPKYWQAEVDLAKSDGSTVVVTVVSTTTRDASALNLEQMIALGEDPGLTMAVFLPVPSADTPRSSAPAPPGTAPVPVDTVEQQLIYAIDDGALSGLGTGGQEGSDSPSTRYDPSAGVYRFTATVNVQRKAPDGAAAGTIEMTLGHGTAPATCPAGWTCKQATNALVMYQQSGRTIAAKGYRTNGMLTTATVTRTSGTLLYTPDQMLVLVNAPELTISW
ncbi:MAG: hypothetical protein J2P15_00585 [Micromonosporaceae bacterium]|nr:hypothetical protein [Micromonosporaceae bacterium]